MIPMEVIQLISPTHFRSTLMSVLLFGILGGSMGAQASSASANFNVKVTIVQNTCVVNNNQPIDVDFGEMLISDIDGVKFEEDIPYTLQCDGADSTQGVKLSFQGTGAGFNSSLLKASEPALGLRFKQNNTVFALNDEVSFTYGSKPSLSVVPVLSSPTGVSSGESTATATFNVEYQ